MIGLTPDGRRILSFDHDRNRMHSPVIDIWIRLYSGDKSVAAYLRQLKISVKTRTINATIAIYTGKQILVSGFSCILVMILTSPLNLQISGCRRQLFYQVSNNKSG